MKKITAIVRQSKLEAIKESLGHNNIKGITVTNVIGSGLQQGKTAQYRGNKYIVNLLPKVQIDVVVHDELVEELIRIIVEEARTGEIGDGKIFVTAVEDAVRIRTGERGMKAL